MKKTLLYLSLFLTIEASAVCHGAKVTYDITTGGKDGTYYQIGLNLAKHIAPDACIKLNVLTSNGSLDNAFKLNSANNIKFAIVQHDVLQELKKLSKEGNEKAKNLVKNLRVLMPLYSEEVHLIVNSTSQLSNFADLRNKTISIGEQKSGSAMTAYLLYSELFGEELKKSKTQSFNEALRDLESGDIDAIVKVAGQPVVRLNQKMTKDSAKYIKLLSYNEKNRGHSPIESYYTADIKADSYAWLSEDTPTLSTKSYLITYNYTNKREQGYIKKFVKSLYENLSTLKDEATSSLKTPHPKWKEVSEECDASLSGGWKYYNTGASLCRENGNLNTHGDCSKRDRALGLCE